MKEADLEVYIAQLLATEAVDEKIINEIPNVKLMLKIYEAGLLQKPFPLESVAIEEIPALFHTLVAQMAILKSGKGGKTSDYLFPNVKWLLEEFKYFFLASPSGGAV